MTPHDRGGVRGQRRHTAMIKFIKENSYLIFKMMVNQLGMLMFGMVLSMATFEDDKLHLFTSIFAIGFYMVLLYMMCWEQGQKEKVRVDHGRMKLMPFKGLYMSLCANVVNILLAVLLTVGFVFITDMANQQPTWAYNLFDSARMFALFIQAMFMGTVSILDAQHNPITYFIIILPALASSTLGYYFGVKGIRIFGFGRRNDKNTDTEQK